MTRSILRRFKRICAKANREAKAERSCGRSAAFSPKKNRRRAAKNVAAATWNRRKAEKNSRRGRRKSTRRVPSRQGRRRKAKKGFNWIVRICCFCALLRGLQNLEASFIKGFNCCGAKLRLRCAKSRFEKPRSFLQRGRFSCFSLVRKEPKVHQRFANLWTPGTIQSSAGKDFVKLSSGTCRNRFCPQNAGVKALNRCERVTVVQTQDCCFSKKNCCTASSQQQAIFEKGCCTLVFVRWEVGVLQC